MGQYLRLLALLAFNDRVWWEIWYSSIIPPCIISPCYKFRIKYNGILFIILRFPILLFYALSTMKLLMIEDVTIIFEKNFDRKSMMMVSYWFSGILHHYYTIIIGEVRWIWNTFTYTSIKFVREHFKHKLNINYKQKMFIYRLAKFECVQYLNKAKKRIFKK